jgi:beta-aspartyl-peptidase (threonine type)
VESAARIAIAVHGGAGNWEERNRREALAGVRRAAAAGFAALAQGASALDAVTAAVVVLEDDPLFNAGTGSALNLAGEAEMDACVMEGTTRRVGAVGAIRGVKNPVLVARKVLEETDHALLAGEGALRFARELGFPPHDPVTEARRRDFHRRLAELREAGARELPALRALLAKHPALAAGTVGAVALDRSGVLAAATSTGGLTLKLPGRVGDTPVPGAGTYATPEAAASATGNGETILRLLLTRDACDRVVRGEPPGEAARRAVEGLASLGGHGGILLLDARGRLGIAHDTPAMPHAWCSEGGGVAARMGV